MAGFKFIGTINGANMRIETFLMKTTETLNPGDMVNIEATSNVGEADLAATADVLIAGVVFGADDPDDQAASGAIAGTDSVTKIQVIVNHDAVYEVTDANARAAGATLDIAGTTGAQTVATSSNVEFVVVRNSTASEKTHVMISQTSHYLYVA